MNAVGIICEYNPFHNGHLHHIEETRKSFPDATIVLILNGYFLERGEISILSKYDKALIALKYGVDLVIELPFVFGTQSADTFARRSIELLHNLKVNKLVFGSESNDISMLKGITNIQLYDHEYSDRVKYYLDQGVNYPTALAKSLNIGGFEFLPNDLLGISYIKAIEERNYKIIPYTIKRTSGYHDTESNETIVSASNIRKKLNELEDITPFIPKNVFPLINKPNELLFFQLLKYKIIASKDLSIYLDVDEGIEHRLKEKILECKNLEDFVQAIKTKRYTYNKIKRMLLHILIGLTKKDNENLEYDYIHILGFTKKGQEHLYQIKKEILLSFNIDYKSKIYFYEKQACLIYDLIMNTNEFYKENMNKPIIE